MNTRRLRLVRPKWTLGTMLLIVGWSAVVVWLNVRPRTYEVEAYNYATREPTLYHLAMYGYPLNAAYRSWHSEENQDLPDDSWGLIGSIKRSDAVPISLLPSECQLNHWRLAANIAIGLLAVAVLTFASKYLVRAIVAGLRSLLSKPPPANGEGQGKASEGN